MSAPLLDNGATTDGDAAPHEAERTVSPKSCAVRLSAALVGVAVGALAIASVASDATDLRVSRNGSFVATVALGSVGIAGGALNVVLAGSARCVRVRWHGSGRLRSRTVSRLCAARARNRECAASKT